MQAGSSAVSGVIEYLSNVRVRGWAKGPTPEPIRLRVMVDGHTVAKTWASRPRHDLGPHGFEHVFEPPLPFRPDLSIRVLPEGQVEDELPRFKNLALARELLPSEPIRRLRVPLYESPFMREIAALEGWSAERLAFVEEFAETGLARLKLDAAWFEPLRERVISGLEERYAGQPRLMDAWRYEDSVRELACSEQIAEALKQLFGRTPIPMQTLNFPVGTQQSTHSDTVHFNSLPAGFMCGAWVALEPITKENGPLHYYPGSHRMPIVDLCDIGVIAHRDLWSQNYEYHQDVLRELIRVKALKKATVEADPGDVIIWAANLLHGGEPILNPASTRHSQVTHFYFEGCSYYSPMRSNLHMGQLHHVDRRDIRTGQPLKHHFEAIELPWTPSPD